MRSEESLSRFNVGQSERLAMLLQLQVEGFVVVRFQLAARQSSRQVRVRDVRRRAVFRLYEVEDVRKVRLKAGR